jgi:hypothetical protein
MRRGYLPRDVGYLGPGCATTSPYRAGENLYCECRRRLSGKEVVELPQVR